MQFSRKQMEAEADRLGVPWTHTTTDEQLHALIQSRLRGENMANSEEFTTPECYGEFWDFPKEETCKGCPGQEGCFQKFYTATFPQMQAKLGPSATLAQLAKALDVSQEAVLVAMNQQSKAAPPPVPAPVQTGVPETEEVEEEPEEEEVEELEEEVEEEVEEEEDGDEDEDEGEFEDADELEDELEAEPEDVEPEVSAEPDEPEPSETEMAAKKKTKKKATTKKKAATKKAPAKKAASKKAPAKKKAAAKKPAKTPPPVSSASEVQDPPKAESAKTATGSAKSKARAKSASRVKGQAGPSKTGGAKKGSRTRKAAPKKKPASKKAKAKKASRPRGKDGLVEDPWGAHTWEPRWARERKRSKAIKALRPGMKLNREYQGETHTVTVLKKFYRYKGQDFPTLYSIVKEITGTKEAPRQLDKKGKRPEGTRQLCNWSAPKFFNLKA